MFGCDNDCVDTSVWTINIDSFKRALGSHFSVFGYSAVHSSSISHFFFVCVCVLMLV